LKSAQYFILSRHVPGKSNSAFAPLSSGNPRAGFPLLNEARLKCFTTKVVC
jgi:hypothetical protein